MTTKEIIKKIKVGKANKITLQKTRSKVTLWWEDKDKWFCNVQTDKEESSAWVTYKDLPAHLNSCYLKNNFKLK